MRGRIYPDFSNVGVDLDDVRNHLFVLDVFELDLVEIHVLASHSLIRFEEHRIGASHTTDAAVEVCLRLHLKPKCHIPTCHTSSGLADVTATIEPSSSSLARRNSKIVSQEVELKAL